MVKAQRYCIFCGAAGLTKEHILANWLRRYIPREKTSYSQHRDSACNTKEETVRKLSGDPHSRSVKVVCRTCNNGWMAKLQEQAKPILLPLLRAQSAFLGPREQGAVATW